MPISFPPLHRDPLPAGTAFETYRKNLAAAAQRVQSEGYQ